MAFKQTGRQVTYGARMAGPRLAVAGQGRLCEWLARLDMSMLEWLLPGRHLRVAQECGGAAGG